MGHILRNLKTTSIISAHNQTAVPAQEITEKALPSSYMEAQSSWKVKAQVQLSTAPISAEGKRQNEHRTIQ